MYTRMYVTKKEATNLKDGRGWSLWGMGGFRRRKGKGNYNLKK